MQYKSPKTAFFACHSHALTCEEVKFRILCIKRLCAVSETRWIIPRFMNDNCRTVKLNQILLLSELSQWNIEICTLIILCTEYLMYRKGQNNS